MTLRPFDTPMASCARQLLAGAILTTLATSAAGAQAERVPPRQVEAPPRSAAVRPAPRAPARPAAVRPAPLTSPVDGALFKGLKYRMIGPARGGRVTTVTGVNQQPHTFYFASTGGGVWKTTDAGQNWMPMSDGQISVGSMGDIDVADSDPNVVYVGTGSDGIRSNVSIGKGVWRSNDAGKTWMHAGLPNVGNIGGVEIHPSDPEVVYVAAIGNPFKPNADRGVYRTRNGGRSWDKVLYVSDSTGAVDVEFQPGNPNVLYASMWRAERKPWTVISGAREGGIYKSTDGGDNWTKLGGGLPTGLFGKSNVAVSAANPNRVYALLEAAPGGGLYRSEDAGTTWALVSSMPQLITRPFYYVNITADPANADIVYVGTEGFFKSIDGGKTFRSVSVPHGDSHDLWINPTNSALSIQSNDGGANISLNGMLSWSTQYNQPTAEIYQVAVDNQFPYRVYGAQQDNSTLIMTSLPLSSGRPDDAMQEWRAGPGCETGPIIPHPTNPDTVYGSCKGQYSRMSLRAGQEKQYWVGAQSLYGNPGKVLIYRFQRVSPMEISPFDSKVVYYGSQYVHRTRDEGVTWETISPDLTWNPPERQQAPSGEPITLDVTGEEYYSTLYAIRESPLEAGVIWTGANDGPFHISRDNGRTWTNVTPPDLAKGGRVQNIELSPHRRGSAYYAVHRYLLGDFEPYIYRTDDYGKTWTRLTDGTNGIPADEPTRVVREDPDREGLLYAGTEFGMYISFDNGKQWQPFQLNLPNTPVTDLRVHRKDIVLSTQGRGFWILDNLTPLHQASDALAKAPAQLLKPRDAFGFRYFGSFGGVGADRGSPADPEYPPAGAMIDYWLGAPAQGALTLDVLDTNGKVLRRFSSEAPGERQRPPAEPGMRRPTMETVGTPRLPNAQGTNRFTWDLTLPGPWDANPERSGRGGPTILPGTYTVRLTSGEWSATQPLVVKADPRVTRDGVTLADMREQLEHNLRARDMISEVNELVVRVNGERERLTSSGSSAAEMLAKLNELRAKLVTPPIRYSQPGLQAHIQYLYRLTDGADQKIGRDAIARYRVLRAELDTRIREARALVRDGKVAD